MKKIITLLAIIITLSSCKSRQDANIEKPEKVVISQTSIQNSMEFLASDDLKGRVTGTEGIEKAAVFIEDYLKENGVKPFFETYRDNFEFENSRASNSETESNIIKGFNVVGVIEGNDPKLKEEYIILGGHYDHIDSAKVVDGDSIANGANDDASGTIAAMELGRYFSKTKTNKRSILITLYAAEEMGLKGSEHLAKRLKSEGVNVYTMINFEMIGVPRAEGEPMAYMTGYKRSNFAPMLNKYAGEEVVGFFPKAKEFRLFFRSDNFPFFKAFNIPAHAISTFDFTNFDYYHHVDDEASQMDYEHMTRFINKMIPALEGMMNAPTKEIKMNEEQEQ